MATNQLIVYEKTEELMYNIRINEEYLKGGMYANY